MVDCSSDYCDCNDAGVARAHGPDLQVANSRRRLLSLREQERPPRRIALLLRTTTRSAGGRLLLGKGAVLPHRLARPLAVESDDKQHWPPTCFEEKQGTSPLLLPLRLRL